MSFSATFSDVPGRRRDPWPALLIAAASLTGALILGLLACVVWLSLTTGLPGSAANELTLDNYRELLAAPEIWGVLVDTALFGALTTLIALLFGVPIAMLAERTDLPGKRGLVVLMSLGLLVPSFAPAIGWLFLMHPRIGLINHWVGPLFGLTEGPFNVLGISGMAWVQGLSLAPLAFVMTAGVLRAMDPTLEEAAEMSGARRLGILRRITLPLAWPGIMAAAIYIFVIGFAAFDVPAILGLSTKQYTFSTYLYSQINVSEGLPRYGYGAALSTVMMLLAVGLSIWYGRMQNQSHRYSVVTGKAYRPAQLPLGRRRRLAWGFIALYLVLSQLVPLVTVIYASFLPFFRPPSAETFAFFSLLNYRTLPWELVTEGFLNTLLLMLGTATLTVALSLCFSWVYLRSQVRGRAIFDFLAFLPHAVPNVVFGMGALIFALYVAQQVVPIYGTLWVLLAVFVIGRLSYGTRMTNSAMLQLHRELEESAAASGAGVGTILRRIVVPLLGPTLAYAWLWIALLTYRELTLAVFLSTSDNLTLPVVVWSMWQGGSIGRASALAVICVAAILPFVIAYCVFALRGNDARPSEASA